MHDSSRVVASILPRERDTLVEIRNYNYDETIREMQKRRQSAPSGPRLNKFGRMAAGYVAKKSEKREELERQRQLREQQRLSASPNALKKQNVVPEGPKVIKSDIEL